MSVANPNFVAASELTAGLADITYKTYNEIPPDGYLAATVDRNVPMANSAILTLGKETVSLLRLEAGTRISRIAFWSGTTAAGTPTNQWFTIRNSGRTLLTITADDLTNPWAANSEKILNLASVYVVPYSGYFYLGVMVAGTTAPSLMGPASIAGIISKPPAAAGFDNVNGGLTTPATAIPTLNSLSSVGTVPYAAVL